MTKTLAAVLLLSLPSIANDKPQKTYPEHGEVIATEIEDLGAISRGGTGRTVPIIVRTCTVKTDTMEYKIGTARFSVGDTIDFRIEKNRVFMRGAKGKEERYSLMGARKRFADSK